MDRHRQWYSSLAAQSSRASVPAVRFAALAFQEYPEHVVLADCQREHAGLWALLSQITDADERREVFWHYYTRYPWGGHSGLAQKLSLTSIIRGWGVDSNGKSGAILKGWAQRCFGLRIIHHGNCLHSEDDQVQIEQLGHQGKVGSIPLQLDYLYTYTQGELDRRYGQRSHFTLWRGTHDPELYEVKHSPDTATPLSSQEQIVEFNSISSFTHHREIAWEFGYRVWRVKVPREKILMFPGILPPECLQGEAEVLVLGGDYRVAVEKA